MVRSGGSGAVHRSLEGSGGAGRRGRAALRRVAAVVLLALGSALYLGCLAGAAAAAEGDDLVKVYVVKTAEQNGGTPDTLANAAARTLGDPNRAGEIFELNRGRVQADGSALQNPADLRAGWILRLPADARGPDVRLARETGGGTGQSGDAGQPDASGRPGGTGQSGDTQPGDTQSGDTADTAPAGTRSPQDSTAIVLPLPAVLAGLGTLLLALLTAGIMARRQVRRAFGAVARAVHRLGEPARRARRLRFRRSLTTAFAGDGESPRLAYGALAELTGSGEHAVHAVSVGDGGVTAWVATTGTPPAPWRDLGEARWWRPAGAFARPSAHRPDVPAPCLVAVGVDERGGKVFVDLGRLDGALSVTGDRGVARDVVQGLLAGVARDRPAVPVAVIQVADGLAVALPPAMPRVEPSGRRTADVPAAARGTGTLRATARPRPLEALLVVPGTPAARENAELAALSGPGGAGWTALVCGDADGSHWRWRASPDGSVEIPVLRLAVTAPA
ncbi:hypothetical protein AB0G15_12150 [Streptosporangium sp. NPDC023825]|uniref:hypothetical protein n=1 Tax=Streptosporangium sp. NPDC023825 TaxID=3154909 RepID=UPI003435463A